MEEPGQGVVGADADGLGVGEVDDAAVQVDPVAGARRVNDLAFAVAKTTVDCLPHRAFTGIPSDDPIYQLERVSADEP